MRYRLRTLLMLLVIGPPMLAGAWSYYSDYVERDRSGRFPADNSDLDVKLTLETFGGNAPWGMSRWDTPKEPPPMFRFTIRDVLWLTVVVIDYCRPSNLALRCA